MESGARSDSGNNRSVLRDVAPARYRRRSRAKAASFVGQALMAAADTAFVFAVSAASGRYRPMTTVDQTRIF